MQRQPGKDRNLRVFAVTHFLSGLASSMMQAVWQPFVLSLGAPMSTLGLLESIGGAGGIVTAIIQPIGGWLSDRKGRKPFIVLGGVAGVLAVGFYVVAAATKDWRWLLGGIVLMGMTLIARPARDSLVAESATANRRGMAFSALMAAWVAPGIFAPTLGGFIAERWGFTPVFVMRLVFDGLRVLLLVWFLRETLRGTSEAVSRRELKGVMARMFWPPAELRGLYWAMAID
ncbi:MAG TPA: MFS transporter, partial [Anaerolineae bacterium]|nr:MFS transporter [Anaerolineae bacterium]